MTTSLLSSHIPYIVCLMLRKYLKKKIQRYSASRHIILQGGSKTLLFSPKIIKDNVSNCFKTAAFDHIFVPFDKSD
jgi:hypothetical protein